MCSYEFGINMHERNFCIWKLVILKRLPPSTFWAFGSLERGVRWIMQIGRYAYGLQTLTSNHVRWKFERVATSERPPHPREQLGWTKIVSRLNYGPYGRPSGVPTAWFVRRSSTSGKVYLCDYRVIGLHVVCTSCRAFADERWQNMFSCWWRMETNSAWNQRSEPLSCIRTSTCMVPAFTRIALTVQPKDGAGRQP